METKNKGINSKESNTKAAEQENISTKAAIEETLNQVNNSLSKAAQKSIKKNSSKVVSVEDIGIDTRIECTSIVFGGLTYKNPNTNALYRWNEIGASEFLTFGELITMSTTKPDFLRAPLIIVQDERVVEFFNLLETYQKVAQINNLEKIFTKPLNEISLVLDNINRVDMRDVAISRIRQMRKDGTLKDIDVIRLIEEKFKFDLSEDSE